MKKSPMLLGLAVLVEDFFGSIINRPVGSSTSTECMHRLLAQLGNEIRQNENLGRTRVSFMRDVRLKAKATRVVSTLYLKSTLRCGSEKSRAS